MHKHERAVPSDILTRTARKTGPALIEGYEWASEYGNYSYS